MTRPPLMIKSYLAAAAANARGARANTAALATAERNNLQGENKLALASAKMAMNGLKPGTPDYLRAQDIAMVSEAALKKDKKKKK